MRLSVPIVSLFLLLSMAPVGLAQGGGPYLVEDDAGDVAAGAGDTRQPVPSVDRLPYIDLTKLEIKDIDEELVEFRLSNAAGFNPAPSDYGSTSYIGLQQTRHQIHFTVVGIGSAPTKAFLETGQLRMRIENETNVKDETVTTNVDLCVPLPGSQTCDFFSRFYLEHRVEEGVLVIPVPKEFLTSQAAEARSFFGGAGGASALPPRLYVGDKLTDIYVIGEEPVEIFASDLGMPTVEVEDRMPDSGSAPEFVFQYPSATNDLLIHYPPWSVIAGEENIISLQIDNKAPVKRIVNLTVSQDPQAGDPWPASISPSVTVPAGQSTNVTLRVKPPALKDGVGDLAIIKIRGNVITQPGNVAVRTSYMMSTSPLDKDHSTFYFTGDVFRSGIPVLPSYGFGWLTRLEAEAARSTEPIPFNSFIGLTPTGGFELMQYAWDDGGIPNAATFRKGEAGKAQLEFESPAAFEGSISLQLTQNDILIAQHVGEVSVGQGRTIVEAPLNILPDVTRLDPKNGTLFLTMVVSSSGAQAQAISLVHFAGQQVALIPKSTFLQLPLERDLSVTPLAAPFKVSLAASEDLEAFINPGKTQVFEFDLRNEEAKAVRVELAIDNKTADWPVEIRPGLRYKLDGNESAHLGVLVTAPSAAKEGFQLTFNVLARDAESTLPVAVSRLHLIVTSGVDIENETFEVTAEDAAKVETAQKKSPGLPIVVALAVVGGLAFLRRRIR